MIVLLPTPDDPSSAPVRSGRQVRRHLIDTLVVLRADHVHGHVAGHSPDLCDLRRQVGRKIGLGQHDDRCGPALASEQQVALEATQREIGVEPHDDEDDVDIRGDHLLVGDLSGHLPGEPRAPRQHRDDRAAVLVGSPADGDPVAHGRKRGAVFRSVLEAAGSRRVELAVVDVDAIVVVELDGDARRLEIGAHHVLSEVPRKRLVPPQLVQPHRLIMGATARSL